MKYFIYSLFLILLFISFFIILIFNNEIKSVIEIKNSIKFETKKENSYITSKIFGFSFEVPKECNLDFKVFESLISHMSKTNWQGMRGQLILSCNKNELMNIKINNGYDAYLEGKFNNAKSYNNEQKDNLRIYENPLGAFSIFFLSKKLNTFVELNLVTKHGTINPIKEKIINTLKFTSNELSCEDVNFFWCHIK